MERELVSPVRVLVVDDHEVVRRGLIALLGARGRFKVVAQAATVRAAMSEVALHRPDIVVMDLRLPDGSGIDACRAICDKHPATRVVIFTSYPDAGGVDAAAEAGAAGYLLKRARARDLVAAMNAVADGETLLERTVQARTRDNVRRLIAGERSDELGSLSPQEQRVLDLLVEGLSNQGIARSMHLSDKTVKNYVSAVLGKLGLQRRTQAAAFVAHHQGFAH
jgi:two-component system, NarL family, response regulator DevR